MAWAKNVNWHEFDSIPQNLVELYLSRLGLEQEEPSLKFLNKLCSTQQMTIPYENLDTIDFNKPISLVPSALVEKILVNKRGGHCFELNGLFSLLLQSLGFNAWMCPCRQLRHKEGTMVPTAHCGVLVYINELWYFCDVGYGGPVPLEAMELTLRKVQTIAGKKFVFKPAKNFPLTVGNSFELSPSGEGVSLVMVNSWIELHRYHWKDGVEEVEPVIQILPSVMLLRDFYGVNFMRTQGGGAFGNRLLYLATEDGFRTIVGNQLIIKEGENTSSKEFSLDDLPGILRNFNLMLDHINP